MDIHKLKQAAFDAIETHRDKLYELSKAIWDKPELCFEEHAAHDLLTSFLESHGFLVERHYILPTAFRATYGTGSGPIVAVLCEYDALPSIGHACGHNLIAELGVAVGLGIKAAMDSIGDGGGIGKVCDTQYSLYMLAIDRPHWCSAMYLSFCLITGVRNWHASRGGWRWKDITD